MTFLDTLRELSMTKKLIAAGAVAAMLFLLMTLAKVASRPPMALLYAGVDQMAAAEIVTELDKEGVAYSVDGERIYVQSPDRDRLRLTLAQEGLPRQSIAGYELLENLNGFSTTSDLFSATYWRAKEGEIVRTLMTMPGLRTARVHIGASSTNTFSRDVAPRTASVTISAPGGLGADQVRAIQHLTALAVANLRPDNVAVIETSLGLLTDTGGKSAGVRDEQERENAIESDLVRLLEARVGPGNVRVTVAMQISREREAMTEQVIDPDTAVVTSRSRRESRENEVGQDQAVTIASDLPDGDAEATENRSDRTETTEDVTFAVSTRDRTVERLPGAVERMTIAVLLNVPSMTGEEAADGAPAEARSPEELAALRELVETAAGINIDRGDRVTIQSMAFEPIALEPLAEQTPSSPLASIESEVWRLGQLGFLGLITLIIGLFVVRPILKGQPATNDPELLVGNTSGTPDPVALLRQTSSETPDEAAKLLNAWLEEEIAA